MEPNKRVQINFFIKSIEFIDLFIKLKNGVTDVENKLVEYQGMAVGGRGWASNWEIGIDIYTHYINIK